jgi:glutamate/tyrosine decarboxylase-like PLP-dependent enzyme
MYWTIKTIVLFVVLAALSFSHYFVYNEGQKAVHSLWTKDKLTKATAETNAADEALKKLQTLQAEKQKVDQLYVQEKRKAAVAASGAQHELNRLRDTITSGTTESNNGSSTISRVDGGTRLEQELLGQCAATLVAMAAEADRLETVVVGLQSYVKNICLAK